MEFKKVMRGYAPEQVDKYIADTAEREAATRRAQRERIQELSEENYNLRERIVELQRMQNDISDALITAHKVANEMEKDAQDYANKALFEAKKFYATWQAYAKTIVATFSEEELAAFNALQRKIGEVIDSYEAKQSDGEKKAKKPSHSMTPEEFVKKIERRAEELNEKAGKAEKNADAADATEKKEKANNPISRVEQAAGQSIDLRELYKADQSLEELCTELGLIDSDGE